VERQGLRVALVAGAAWAVCGAAHASYGQMKLDGIASALFLTVWWLWGFAVGVFALVGWFRMKIVLGMVLAISAALLALLVLAWDGGVYLRPRPLGSAGFLVVRMLVVIPLAFVIPVMLYVYAQRGEARRHLGVVLLLGFLLVPVEAIGWSAMQTLIGELAIRQAQQATPGTVQAHVQQSSEFAARIPFKPWVWTEQQNHKLTAGGISNLAFVKGPDPLVQADRDAVLQLVALMNDPAYAWQLEGKLQWDEFLQAPAAQRPALASRMEKGRNSSLVQNYLVPYTDRLCPQLDEPTQQALHTMLRRAFEEDRKAARAVLKAKCGWVDWDDDRSARAIGAMRPLPSAGSAGISPPPPVRRE
jgi:hypothetical protein